MVKGTRRYSAPPGYMSSAEAVQKLGKMLYKHVDDGRVRKIVPEGHKHGFYNRDDVEKVLATEQLFSSPYVAGQWKKNPSSTFGPATEQDMPAIVEISRAIFGDPVLPSQPRLAWLRKNSETFFVLRDHQEQRVVGYVSILPLKRETIGRFIRDEIGMQDITADDVERYEPGKPLHLYIMAVGVDPKCGQRKKHEYGARIVHELFGFFFDLATRGIEIETVTARSHKPDGLRLLRRMGIPQLRSPVPGKSLFAVNVAESGYSLFERYSEILSQATKIGGAP